MCDKDIRRNNMPLRRIEVNKNNELIHITFNHKPSPMQRKVWDLILFQVKRDLENMKNNESEKYISLKKKDFEDYFMPIKIDLDFMLSVLQIDRHNKKVLIDNIYQMAGILITEIRYKDVVKIRNEQADGAILKGVDYDNVNIVSINQIMVAPKIDFEKKYLKCYVLPLVIRFADKKKDYTRIDVLVNAFFGSTYTINLYEILLNKFKAQKEMMEKGKIERKDSIETAYIDIDNLKKIIGLKENHSWYATKYFNKRILEPSIKEINNTDVTEFIVKDYKFKRENRKIVAISFILQKRKDRKIPFLQGDEVVIKDIKRIIRNEEKESANANAPASVDAKDISNKSDEIIQQLHSESIKFIDFVKLLKHLKNFDLANNIDGYEPHILLRTNDLGFLELFNPIDNQVIELDSKKDFEKLNNLKVWLYRNREKIGKVEKIDTEKVRLEKLMGKYIIFKDKDIWRYILVQDVEKQDENKIVIQGKDILNGEDIKLEFTKDKIENTPKDEEIDKAKLQELATENKKTKYQKYMRFFEQNRNKFEEYVNALSEKIVEYDMQSKEYKILNKFLSKAMNVILEDEPLFYDDVDLLKHFYDFATKKRSEKK